MIRNFFLLTFLILACSCGSAGPGIDEGDAKVIQALKDNGSDLSKPHPIDFYFVEFPNRGSAERFGREVLQRDWKLDVHQTPDAANWTLVASTLMVPDPKAISSLSAKFNALAPKYGGDYDGWEAAVTR